MVELKVTWKDYVALVVFAAFAAGVILLNRAFPLNLVA